MITENEIQYEGTVLSTSINSVSKTIISSNESKENNLLFYHLIILSFIIFIPALEYYLVKPRCGKTQWIIIFLSIDSNTDKLKTLSSLNHLNNYWHRFQPFTITKTKQLGDGTCLSLGQQQQWEAVPPYQLLESAQIATPQDPRACSGLLARTRCSKSNTSLQNSVLLQNLTVSSPQLISCNNQVTAAFLSEQLPYYFSLFPLMNFLNINHLNEFSLENI